MFKNGSAKDILTATQRLMEKIFDRWRKVTGIGFTCRMRGKMRGMLALSTSPNGNERCNARAACGNPDCICTKCYAKAQCAYQHGTETKLECNGRILSERLIPVEDWIHINYNAWRVCRLESHGDVRNAIHAANYFNCAKANPKITFTVWTKNYDFYVEADKMVGKPSNFILIISSPMLNDELDLANYPLSDRVFTVYTKEWLAEHNAKPSFINCGAKLCKGCMICYTQGNGIQYIHEILKSDSNAVHKRWVENGDLTIYIAEKMVGHHLNMGKRWDRKHPNAKHAYAKPTKAIEQAA